MYKTNKITNDNRANTGQNQNHFLHYWFYTKTVWMVFPETTRKVEIFYFKFLNDFFQQFHVDTKLHEERQILWDNQRIMV